MCACIGETTPHDVRHKLANPIHALFIPPKNTTPEMGARRLSTLAVTKSSKRLKPGTKEVLEFYGRVFYIGPVMKCDGRKQWTTTAALSAKSF